MSAPGAIAASSFAAAQALVDASGKTVPRGATVLLAGVLGGLLTLGIVGLFIGPVVLAIAYRLLEAWIGEGAPPKRGA